MLIKPYLMGGLHLVFYDIDKKNRKLIEYPLKPVLNKRETVILFQLQFELTFFICKQSKKIILNLCNLDVNFP